MVALFYAVLATGLVVFIWAISVFVHEFKASLVRESEIKKQTEIKIEQLQKCNDLSSVLEKPAHKAPIDKKSKAFDLILSVYLRSHRELDIENFCKDNYTTKVDLELYDIDEADRITSRELDLRYTIDKFYKGLPTNIGITKKRQLHTSLDI